MSRTAEGKVKDKTKLILNKFDVWYYMPVSMGFGQHGIPDFLCSVGTSVGAITFAIETKARGGKPTPLQLAQMAKMNAHGITTFVIDDTNYEELEQWLIRATRK